ncbi:PREDICTED: CLK4-associating serine/arginine rich protein [Corvus brachyrhynchos]|uniref:CLK4-associating serine/arginine rich protein n=1 Tax=Corvus brachyrhynchos TaxID=85066 RepID=UPI0008164F5F|nr:PREDICTED: CLK4-associating serine/arginine rich protein [Corvus brachyrhynchos]
MWHEARKHERKLRGMMVDYKKRAERRREYYEKIVRGARKPAGTGLGGAWTSWNPVGRVLVPVWGVLDPFEPSLGGPGPVGGGLSQIQKSAFLVEPPLPGWFFFGFFAEGKGGGIPTIPGGNSRFFSRSQGSVFPGRMPWQGDTNNMIDRFDVRAHLDFIPMYTPALLSPTSPEQESDERKCNYERYRGLVQNDFAGISEEQCLYQIYIDELYGGLQKPNEDEKKKLAEKKASIGYTYEDSTVEELENSLEKRAGDEEDSEEDSNTDEDEVIPDIDVEVDVDELNQEQVADLNKQATTYGMAEGDFVRMLRKDKEEAEAIKNAKALEEEKAMYSGRRSRRQRREFREKRLKGRKISPPR